MRKIAKKPCSSDLLFSIDKNASCGEAVELMAKHHVHHLAVTENGDPIGILNDRDILFRWVRGSFESRDTFDKSPITTIVRTHLPVATEKTTLAEVLEWMDSFGTSSLLVRNGANNWSIVTESDLLSALNFILRNHNWPRNLLFQGEAQMTSPLIQKLIETLTQMGI